VILTRTELEPVARQTQRGYAINYSRQARNVASPGTRSMLSAPTSASMTGSAVADAARLRADLEPRARLQPEPHAKRSAGEERDPLPAGQHRPGARLNSNRTFTFDRDLDNPNDNPLVAAVYQKDANLNGRRASPRSGRCARTTASIPGAT